MVPPLGFGALRVGLGNFGWRLNRLLDLTRQPGDFANRGEQRSDFDVAVLGEFGRTAGFLDETRKLGVGEACGLEILLGELRATAHSRIEARGQGSQPAGARRQRFPMLGTNPSIHGLARAFDRGHQRSQFRFVLAQVAIRGEQAAHAAGDFADLAPLGASRRFGKVAAGDTFFYVTETLPNAARDPPGRKHRNRETEQAGATDRLHDYERIERRTRHGHRRDHAGRRQCRGEGAHETRYP